MGPAAYLKATFAAALCVAVLGTPSAHAQSGSLRDGLFNRRAPDGRQFDAPPTARYVAEGGVGFVFDRSQRRPMLKFDDSPEVWVLQPQPAPRGDVIYKNDQGEPMLRATRLGGVTVFTDRRPSGLAAALAGGTSPLRLAPLGPQALLERLAQASARASRAVRRLMPFDAEATPASSALIADAAIVTSEAMVRMSRQPRAQKALNKIRRVQLVEGGRPSAEMAGDVLMITVSPAQGLAGRPSSDRIRIAAGR
ncbi:DUF4908 domain-containing protein [Phenylobacterium sp.]|jgi:hypothetical protein|uniref:DUF4908 domain-containing protein n=1 Tax=Phenylobacterium sp. TaxID=1871053 RepID=UPI003783B3C3